jgi:TetR/AcrR family transcriptional repressor of nem operon
MGRVSDAKQRLMDAVLELIWQGSYSSTTIDQICQKADVRKGSFYHFFDSKSALAAEALDTSWQQERRELDSLFSPSLAPLVRLHAFAERCINKQVDLKKECGRVLGCPLFTLGSEVCHNEERLHSKVKEILGYYHRYFESAIRDAHAEGSIFAPDAASKARMIFAYGEGLLTQARILNDTEVLRDMASGFFAILGATPARIAA